MGREFSSSVPFGSECVVGSVLGGVRCPSNVSTAQIGSSRQAALQLAHPDILAAVSATLYPPPCFKQPDASGTAGRGDVAEEMRGGGGLLSPQPQLTHPIPQKSALGRGHGRHQGRKEDPADREQRSTLAAPVVRKPRGGYFFVSVMNIFWK